MNFDVQKVHYKIKTTNKNINILLDVFFILIILLTLNITLIQPMPEQSHFTTPHEILRFGWLATPILFIYITLRVFRSSAIFSGYLTISFVFLLNHINIEKLALTAEPISFSDLISANHLSIITKYTTPYSLILLLGFIIFGCGCFFIGRRYPTRKNHHILLFVCFLVTAPLAFFSYADDIFGNTSLVSHKINLLAKKYDTVYIPSNWDYNARSRGLSMHLVQTSVRKSVPSATDIERKMYASNSVTSNSRVQRPKTIVYILCESCWYDNNNFKTEFQPLIKAGFSALRATSPVYGGGTANAEFEMLTGLPSNSGVLSGVIYQEYFSLIKDNADTLPSYLHSQGFRSVAAHNYSRSFWHRDAVYQKFGFDKFIAVSDMGELPSEYAIQRKPWQWQPDDFILYRSVLNEISQNSDKPHFFHLVTMSTHGPEFFENDFGENSYSFKLRQSVSRMVDFVEKLSELDPDALIVVYGDHKPGMNRYFYENKIFPPEYYVEKGVKDTDFSFNKDITAKEVGDIPVFIRGGNKEVINKIIYETNEKPFFCLSAVIDKYFINSGLPAFNYNMQHGCSSTEPYNYQDIIEMTPPWVYAISLFK